MKSIYVGNFPYSTTETDLREMFAAHGTVHSVNMITDRETGRPRGFGFIEMDEAEANAAIAALNGIDVGGRDLRVNEARPRSDSGGRRGSGRQGRGGDRQRRDRYYV